ncbi:MAG: hypothetical protein AAF658_21645, partial [Myxococcota bacterium]
VSFPIELTTSFTLLSVATLYGGVGTDIQTGDATIRASLSGTLDANNPTDGQELDIGTVQVEANETADASPGRIRALVGLQANLWKLKAFVQVNSLPGVAASVAGGVKLAF